MQTVRTMGNGTTLPDVIERVLDKGIVLNADISVYVAGTELLGIRIRATLASFETAARYGMELPAGTNPDMAVWKEAAAVRENCPGCGKRHPVNVLLSGGCPWCGWQSPSNSGAKKPSGGTTA